MHNLYIKVVRQNQLHVHGPQRYLLRSSQLAKVTQIRYFE